MSHQTSDIITPKALLLDERLTPLERNAWLTFRALASSDGTVVLSYDALRKYLPSAPGSKRAALETVSRAVLCLRLSTWIALVEYRRNPMTGFSMASRYAVRNQPLAFDDACMEDEDYLPLLERALGHASVTIRQLAQSILDEAMRHPGGLEKLPATMQARIRRLQHRGDDHDPGNPGGATARDTPMPEASSDIPKPVPAPPTAVRTVEKEVLKEVRTYRSSSEVQVSGPDVPARFRQLPQDQQRVLITRLRGLPPEQRLAVLAEWDARCESGGVLNAIAYLYGLIKKAVEGVFKLWAARKQTSQQTVPARVVSNNPHGSPPAPSPSPSSPPATSGISEIGRQHLQQLRQKLNLPPLPIGQVITNMADSGMLPTASGLQPLLQG
ncbi:STY4528 family pathogenicity island replication protein [Xanthomonas euvesicatoria]|uniref:STY4528 family pathogenicity island replication protein n=1 Tax=Xanthomonas euvesicatoria TaxID=456327 RepID=UPI00210A802A|nr:STY4528 family pathogenicity island replication protein [Xanthomonas euvesicatoria]